MKFSLFLTFSFMQHSATLAVPFFNVIKCSHSVQTTELMNLNIVPFTLLLLSFVFMWHFLCRNPAPLTIDAAFFLKIFCLL